MVGETELRFDLRLPFLTLVHTLSEQIRVLVEKEE
jgi:hypothetical protein